MSWSGGDDQWVWALTTGAADDFSASQFHHVYWSNNYGKKFTDKFPELQKLVRAQAGGGRDPTMDNLDASIKLILVHAGNPQKVILWGEGKFLFLSEDAGATFKVLPVPKGTLGMSHLIRPHPTEPDWLLSIAYRNSCYQGGILSDCAMDLFLSKNFGQTWENLTQKTKGKLEGFIEHRIVLIFATVYSLPHGTPQPPSECPVCVDTSLYLSRRGLWNHTSPMPSVLYCLQSIMVILESTRSQTAPARTLHAVTYSSCCHAPSTAVIQVASCVWAAISHVVPGK